MKITIICTFVLMAWSFSATSAYPDPTSSDKFDADVSGLEYDYRNSRLRRSYFDEDSYGYYPYYTSYSRPAPVYMKPVAYTQPIRRQDVDDDKDFRYEPLLRYSSRQTQRKKLFVPNLWG